MTGADSERDRVAPAASAAQGGGDWETLFEALGDAAAPDLVAALRDARARGARIAPSGNGRLRLDLAPAYADAAALAGARARLMPYAAAVAAALRAVASADVGAAAAPARVLRPEPPPTLLIDGAAGLTQVVQTLAMRPAIGLDTETTGLDPHRDRLRLIQLGLPDAAYVVDTWRVEDLGALAALLADPKVRKVGQNLKFDLGFLRQRGLTAVEGAFDTMLASQLLAAGEDGPSHSLRSLVRRHLGLALDKREQASDWAGELSASQLAYAALDVSLLVPLADALGRELGREGMARVAAIEMDALAAVAELEASGMAVDAEALGTTLAELLRDREAAATRARALLPPKSDAQARILPEPPNLASPGEVARALRALGLRVADAREESLLEYAQRPEVAAYLAWRHLDKRWAFLDGLARFVRTGPRGEGRVYPEYWQIGATSGRMSCASPNLQQVPRDSTVRRLFAAPPGRALVVADYSQIELRIVAALSGDARMREAFARGEDLHRVTAALLSGKSPEAVTREERQAAKAANFGLVYSMGARGLMEYARQGYGVVMDLEEATRLRERFFAAYGGVAAWHERARREGQATGETRTVAGRLRRFGAGARPGDYYNAPVQGSGADIFKAALARVRRRVEPYGAALCAAVHDEIVVECEAADAERVAADVGAEMEAAAAALVPEVPFAVEAHVVADWSEK